MSHTDNKNTAKRLTASVIAILMLSLCLTITTLALIWSMVKVEDNYFKSGTVKINLNDGKTVIEENEFIFEPGMSVVKEFFIENESTWDVYYKIYLNNVGGGLAAVLEITILDGDKELFKGTALELSDLVAAADDVLKIGQRRDLSILFRFPEEAGNKAQDLSLSFDLCAQAVQTKNNPYKLFD